MKNRKWLFTLFLLGLHLCASGINIHGSFICPSSDIPYRIVIASCDSLNGWNVQSSYYTPSFSIDVSHKGKCKLSVFSGGMELYGDSLEIADRDMDLGTLRPMKSAEISEVVVRARRIRIDRDGMDYTIRNIQGTNLGDAGNLIDMLKWTPGVMVNNGDEISVIGRGGALVYVNGREVVDASELKGLRSDQVTKIEIIRDPSVEYKSGTSAVIRIYTKRPVSDFLGATVSNSTAFRRRTSNYSDMNLNGRKGIVSGNLSFDYGHGNSLSYTNTETSIAHSAGDQYTDLSNVTRSSRNTNSYDLFAGLNFSLSKKSLLVMQYSGSSFHSHPYTVTDHQITEKGTVRQREDDDRALTDKSGRNTVTAGYTLTRNKDSELNLTANYQRKTSDEDRLLMEDDASSDMPLRTAVSTRNNYDVYTFDGNYSFRIKGWKTENAGVNFGRIHNYNPMLINQAEQASRRNDTWFAAYVQAQKNLWKGFSALFGLRYEYDYSALRTPNTPHMNRHTSDFLPEIKLKYNIHDHLYTLRYFRSVSDPSISDLNPVVNYIDSLHYTTGNPYLKSSVWNNLSLTANISNLTLSLDYSHFARGTVNAAVNSIGSNILVYKPINSDYTDTYSLQGDYSFSDKNNRISATVDGGVYYYMLKYSVNKDIFRKDKLWAFVSGNLSWEFMKHWQFYSDLFYESPWLAVNKYIGYQLRADVGVSAKFFKDRLRVSLEGEDLFDREMGPTYYRQRYLNVSETGRYKYDLRGIFVSLRYNFNGFLSRYKRVSPNSTTINRAN
ncbi:MAG: outer membrane beta-barrel family protein [Prevotella sp.]|jgi:hypothetical protein|nr:outer membrane beta-barrel family protein [Prevotella sp.]MCI1474284.1 outer membrane beta-barrel family protein [Prevotella sp.]MCI1549113.1 outer membrane beta-barrel family protein [Prevotella sp.]MCI1596051.1 outer membrane beta-barrel family protein [Prevotella sp.]